MKQVNEFLDFFKVNTESSMVRLITFICAVGAFITSIGAVWLGLKGKLTVEYVGLVATLWGAAFGGKTWAKKVELGGNKNADA